MASDEQIKEWTQAAVSDLTEGRWEASAWDVKVVRAALGHAVGYLAALDSSTRLATLTAAVEGARAALWEMQELIGADRSRTPRFLEWTRLDDLATTADFALFAALAPAAPQSDATGTEGRR